MSQLLDSLFIAFNGEPITGRVPPRVVLHGDVPPSVIAEAAYAYDAFRKQRSVSIIDTHVTEDFLSGGGFMAVHSHGDVDDIEIWGSAPSADLKLPHALVVVASWRTKPTIYKRVELPGAPRYWKTDPTLVPQAAKEILAYNAVELITAQGAFFIAPAVKNSVALWGVDRRDAPNYGTTTQDRAPVPINLRVGTALNSRRSKVHYSFDGLVKNGDATLYTMTPPAHILANQNDGLNYLPSDSTTSASELALNMYRTAYVAETTGAFRAAGERVKRTADTTYEQVERFDTLMYLPPARNDIKTTPKDAGPFNGIWTYSGNWNQFHYSLETGGYYTHTNYSATSYGEQWHLGPLLQPYTNVTTYNARWGVKHFKVGKLVELYGDVAFTKGFGQIVGDETDHGQVAALASYGAVEYAKLYSRFSYPMDGIIRGGGISTYTYTNWYFGDSYPWPYYINLAKNGRMDSSSFSTIADGVARLSLGWLDVKVMDLKALGSMSGSYDVENKQGLTNIDPAHVAAATTTEFVAHDVVPPSYPDETPYPRVFKVGYAQYAAWVGGHPSISAEMATQRANHDGTISGTPKKDICRNKVSYDYATDYIIDYDHRARFCALIRVRVEAVDHHYVDSGLTGYGQVINKVSDPTYTVTISFVSKWMNSETGSVVSAAVELVKETGVTRKGFELYTFEYTNPYVYPSAEADGTRRMKIKMPPRLALPLELTSQFANLSRHQGVNPHIASEHYRPAHVVHKSRKGVEFNALVGNTGRPYHKYPPGMLYARTFKLSDFSDALWLLRALKIDARENDTQDSEVSWPYFYFPVIGGSLASTRHVELRDGVLVNWSDAIPTDGGGSAPSPTSREIKLYRV